MSTFLSLTQSFRSHIFQKFLNEILTKKRKLPEHKIVALSKWCSTTIQHRLRPKLKDPGSFNLPWSIGNLNNINDLTNLGVSINLITLPIYGKFRFRDVKETSIILQLEDKTLKHPYGIVKAMPFKLETLSF